MPVPLPQALTYRVPAALEPLARVGCRVRVGVGSRMVVGVILELHRRAPALAVVKDIARLLDQRPVLPPELIELARFVADYYLAPIGEAVRAMLPVDLPPWGEQRLSLTDAGALTPPRNAEEATLVERLLLSPGARLGDLQNELGIVRLDELVERLRREKRLAVEVSGARSSRYEQAVELRPGKLEELLALCGRSAQGRAVVEMLDALGRPATLRELSSAVGCGSAVVRRLVGRGLLRPFSQPVRLSLERHRLTHGDPRAIVLREDQQRALAAVESALEARRFAAFLLDGMTGTGKTEVYLRAASVVVAQGRSAIVLVPEIALVPALAATARARFGERLAILHSNLSSAERQQEWERVRAGEARVVLGPRSALFAPVADLGLVVVDEEHDASYKQDATPRYNGRDLALYRARSQGAVAVLVSATPSLESRLNLERGKLGRLTLEVRVGQGRWPEGVLVDLRREGLVRRPGEVHFSPVLRQELEAALGAGDQAIVLRNRRGYAPVLLCRACGEDFRCPDCGLPMTYHRRLERLQCHYCGRQRGAPASCPSCGEAALEPMGAGTERVEEQFRALYPGVSVDVLDADAARRTGGAAAVLERFASGRTQVLIGTQMVSKGHHFPRVALAAVLHADTYLAFPDFRAVERTYALLTQLAGRAGRGERPGRVVIQTFHPDHYAIRAALEHDDRAFAEEEMRFRKVFHYPPYTRLVQVLSRHAERERAEAGLQRLAERCQAHPHAGEVRITGPAPAPLERLRGKWRFQLLLRGPSASRLRQLVEDVVGRDAGGEVVVDVDPQDLM